jgi:hypothetical protein
MPAATGSGSGITVTLVLGAFQPFQILYKGKLLFFSISLTGTLHCWLRLKVNTMDPNRSRHAYGYSLFAFMNSHLINQEQLF